MKILWQVVEIERVSVVPRCANWEDHAGLWYWQWPHCCSLFTFHGSLGPSLGIFLAAVTETCYIWCNHCQCVLSTPRHKVSY